MDFGTNTEGFNAELKMNQENNLLEIIKEICIDPDCKLSRDLRGKVNRIVADCDLKHHSSLHRIVTVDESTSTVLGFMHQTTEELTYKEQVELNQAIINKIEKKLPLCINELDHLKKAIGNCAKLRADQVKELKERDSKLDTLQKQEMEKMELMLEWLNYKIQGVTKFSDNSTELMTLKAKILDLKSKILHLQIMQTIFTETNQSIEAYNEIHKDLEDTIKDTEQRIKNFRDIIDGDTV